MNKYILSSILIVGICSSANGQISSYERKSVSSANELVVAAFDSTKIQWSENSLQSFIGQTFIGYCPTIDTNRGYVDIQLFTKKNDPHKRYMQFGNSSYTQCSAIEGKTFNIIDVDTMEYRESVIINASLILEAIFGGPDIARIVAEISSMIE